jgi:hypothetical protein
MVSSISDVITEFDFNELHQVFLDGSYYDLLFPFLLFYALLFTVLGKVGIFQKKETGEPNKPIIVLISLVVSFFGVSFKTGSGMSVGDLLMVMFPDISALTIGILMLYLIGSLLGKDFFTGVFRKDHSAYLYMAIGVIGLGTVIYYVGIALFDWNMNPLDFESKWNVILAIAILIMGVVFLFIDLVPIGILFLFVFFAYVYNYGDGNVLEYFIDPVVFIIVIFISLFAWVNGDNRTEKQKLQKKIDEAKLNLKDYGDNKSVIRDIIEEGLASNEAKLKKLK